MNSPEVIAPCGINCAVCPYLMAHKDGNERLKEKLAASIGIKPEQIACEGCNSELCLFFCKECKLKKCVQKKDIESCASCEEWPCKHVENYPFKPFLHRLRWDVPYQKKHGKKAWIAKTIELNTCPKCKTLNHWRASRCKSCKNELKERYK